MSLGYNVTKPSILYYWYMSKEIIIKIYKQEISTLTLHKNYIKLFQRNVACMQYRNMLQIYRIALKSQFIKWPGPTLV